MGFFILLLIAGIILLILGLIKPIKFVFWTKKKTRGQALLVCSIVIVVSIIGISTISGNAKTPATVAVATSPASSNQNQVAPLATAQPPSPTSTTTPLVTATVPPEPTYEVKDKYLVGDIAQLDDTQVQVTKVEKSAGTKYDKPKDGQEYVIVTIAIKNKGSAEIDYNTYDFQMSNSQGQLSDQAFTIVNTETSLGSGQLMSNGVVTGTVVFEQPIDDSALELIYKPSFWGNVTVKFDVLNSLESFDVLKSDAVSITGEEYAIGEAGASGSTQIIVTDMVLSDGSRYDKPKDGYDYVILTVEITNIGKGQISYNPYYFTMMNSQGQVTNAAFSIIDSDTSLGSGELLSGGKVSGTIVFEQPKGDEGLKLIYEEAFSFSGDKLIFTLK